MKKVLLGTMAVLTLAACSKDEVIQQNPNDEITFTATAGKAISRAQDGYCNKSLPENFKVWARHQADGASTYTSYFAGEQYNKPTSGTTYTQADATKRYWPQSGKLDFFALVNYQGTPTWTATSADAALVVSNYKVESATDPAKPETTPGLQKDFMYAVTPAQATKTATTLNFRHALSQIEFQAKNENSKIYVKVSGVKVMNVKDQGTFTLPVATTLTDKYEGTVSGDKHTALPGNTTINNQGKWSPKSGTAQYTITTLKDDATAINDANKKEKNVPGNGTVVSLTVTDPTGKEYNPNTLYVLPQSFGDGKDTQLWNGTDALMDGSTYKTTTGAYLILTCQIFNVANPNSSAPNGGYVSSDIAVWGGGGAKDIAVKLPNNEWEQGKRYVYTFTFTESGNGGTDPGTGKPVLTPITLSVTVDDFVDGGSKDVDMEKPTPAP